MMGLLIFHKTMIIILLTSEILNIRQYVVFLQETVYSKLRICVMHACPSKLMVLEKNVYGQGFGMFLITEC